MSAPLRRLLLLSVLLCIPSIAATGLKTGLNKKKKKKKVCGVPDFGKNTRKFTLVTNIWEGYWKMVVSLKETASNRTILRIPHRCPHLVPDFDAQMPHLDKAGNEDGKGLLVFHAWNNLVPAFGHKEVTINDCHDKLVYFLEEYDYHWMSWDVNLKICNSRACTGKHILGYSRKAGLFDRAIHIFPADNNGHIEKKAIITGNKTFWAMDWAPEWVIELHAAPGSNPVLDPKIITAILSNRIFAQTGSGQCNQFFTVGVILGGVMVLVLVLFCVCCPRRFFCMAEKSEGDYGTRKLED